MKVQIENTIIHNSIRVWELNQIISKALESSNLIELETKIGNKKFEYFKVGFGSNHCWVKQYHGELLPERVLFITE